MTIDISKILNVSLDEWKASSGKNPFEYHMVGVHFFNSFCPREMSEINEVENFAQNVPDNAEVVIGYNCKISIAANMVGGTYSIFAQYGTALVPKKKN